jgi:limonene-1,2-epoxide hydrolase
MSELKSVEIVRTFFEAYGDTYQDVRNSFERYLSENCEWVNPGMPTAHGRNAILELLDASHKALGLEGTPVTIRNVAGNENIVFVERVDKLVGPGGHVLLDLPVVGVFEVEGDRIVRWREYADSALFASLLPGLSSE